MGKRDSSLDADCVKKVISVHLKFRKTNSTSANTIWYFKSFSTTSKFTRNQSKDKSKQQHVWQIALLKMSTWPRSTFPHHIKPSVIPREWTQENQITHKLQSLWHIRSINENYIKFTTRMAAYGKHTAMSISLLVQNIQQCPQWQLLLYRSLRGLESNYVGCVTKNCSSAELENDCCPWNSLAICDKNKTPKNNLPGKKSW